MGLVVDTVLVVEVAVAVLVGGRWGSNIRAEDLTCHMVIVFFRWKCVRMCSPCLVQPQNRQQIRMHLGGLLRWQRPFGDF